MDSPVALKDQIWFLRVCSHISNAIYFSFNNNKIGDKQSAPYLRLLTTKWFCFEHISIERPFVHVTSTMAHKLCLSQLYFYQPTLPKSATNDKAVSWPEVGVLRNRKLFIPFNATVCSTLTHKLTTKTSRSSRMLLQKLTVPQLVKELPTLYGTQMFITILTTLAPILSQINPIDALPFS